MTDDERLAAIAARAWAATDFIATYREDIAWLLEQLRQARAEIERLRHPPFAVVAEPPPVVVISATETTGMPPLDDGRPWKPAPLDEPSF